MKKIVTVFVLAAVLATSAPLFAAESKNAGDASAQPVTTPGKTVFNSLSDFFSTFDRPFTRPGNKQGFLNATADWMRNINK